MAQAGRDDLRTALLVLLLFLLATVRLCLQRSLRILITLVDLVVIGAVALNEKSQTLVSEASAKVKGS